MTKMSRHRQSLMPSSLDQIGFVFTEQPQKGLMQQGPRDKYGGFAEPHGGTQFLREERLNDLDWHVHQACKGLKLKRTQERQKLTKVLFWVTQT